MFELTDFGLSDTFEVSAAVPRLAVDAPSMRNAAARVVRYFYENAVDKRTGQRSLALAQCFAVRPFDRLPPDLQDLAATASPRLAPHARQWCLTLLASAGDAQVCGDERVARDLATVVVTSTEADSMAPAVTRAVRCLVEENAPRGILRKVDPTSYAIGHVDDARHSDVFAGWSEIAITYGIRGALVVIARLNPDLLVIAALYSKTPIPEATADAFPAVALGLKLAMLPHAGPALMGGGAPSEVALLRAQHQALLEMLRARQEIALEQSRKLEAALELAGRRSAELAVSRAALARSEARASAIIGTALDAVVVMDASGRVVEWNPAAEAIFGFARDEAIGELVGELIVPDDLRARHAAGIAHYLATGEGPLLGRRVDVNAVRRDGTLLPVELAITPVRGIDGSSIFTAFIRDITERREQQAALLASRENFAHIARTLQRSLLPAALPEIRGLDLAAAFHPSRAGSDVGGDFYDVFRLGRGDLMLTLGDVCGKGAEAASITAIARHTVRAVAPELRHPIPVLRRVNATLVEQDIGERFCSMVAARAVPIVHGLRLAVCCAGHPPAVVVRSDGRVERVGVPGDLLGLFPDVRLFEETVQLQHGDTIVFFTDGVTEARRGAEEFRAARAATVLAEARELPAQEMINRLLDAVLAFGGEQSRDDIAILALRSVAEVNRQAAPS